MKIAIIGAGAAGLISEKYALEQGFQCDVFEQTGTTGGTWVYTEKTGVDENGLPIHTSMYKGLMTNLPKETITILDFPHPEQRRSYLNQQEVIDYYNNFADRFNLREHIKFYSRITKIKPLPDKRWTVTVLKVLTKTEESYDYDAVFICNGHYHDPRIPNIPGQDIFKGIQTHSYTYRTPEPFSNQRVLIIGAAASGQDISVMLSKVAEHIFLSHRGVEIFMEIPSNLTEKPAVKEFTENGAVFEDETTETFDVVVYCTGYKYSFPFLSEECGIKMEDNWVQSLHKHIINIEHPTMYFIGIPFAVCVTPMFDIQSRFALAALKGKFVLPSKDDMLKDLERDMQSKRRRGVPQRYAHLIGESETQRIYFEDLAETAGIRRIPPVISKIYAIVKKRRNRQDCFQIIDDENFIKTA